MQHALVYTVIAFGGVLIQLRPAWRKAIFWAALASVFLVHTLAIYFITRALRTTHEGLDGFLFVLVVLTEAGAICSLLWQIAENRTPTGGKIRRQHSLRTDQMDE
jgi:peptidoglycan/LPS O-acetylase OafA/YrhL